MASLQTKTVFLKNGELTANFSEAISLSDQTLTITPARDNTITVYVINQSPLFSEQTIIVNFLEPGAEVVIYGLYQMQEKQSLKIHTTMNHAVPHCTSRQVWKGILADAAKADFEGRIIVAKDAQKTSAHLSNKNLLLSNAAEITTKPFLEIYADDVQCSHGATVGCLDVNALFYLQSRGIPESEARALLIQAFADEIYAHASACATEGST
ncbi:MAG: SufD family Fe-S cluster assembly protein [Coxiellaceae bacterium]|nr:SufD family Fe-S cluster assembly protein [Coxiellaceae bacterium]